MEWAGSSFYRHLIVVAMLVGFAPLVMPFMVIDKAEAAEKPNWKRQSKRYGKRHGSRDRRCPKLRHAIALILQELKSPAERLPSGRSRDRDPDT
jgi:hypothetical protein